MVDAFASRGMRGTGVSTRRGRSYLADGPASTQPNMINYFAIDLAEDPPHVARYERLVSAGPSVGIRAACGGTGFSDSSSVGTQTAAADATV
jgi:hypothetical protein